MQNTQSMSLVPFSAYEFSKEDKESPQKVPQTLEDATNEDATTVASAAIPVISPVGIIADPMPLLHEDILKNRTFLNELTFSELKKIQTVSKTCLMSSKQVMLERIISEDIQNIPMPFNYINHVQFIKHYFKDEFPSFTNYTLKDIYKIYSLHKCHDDAFEIIKLLPKEDFINKLVNQNQEIYGYNLFDFTHFRFDTLNSITRHFGSLLNKIKNFSSIEYIRNDEEEKNLLKLLENIETYTTSMTVDKNLEYLKELKNLRNLTFHWFTPMITYQGLEYLCKEINQITSLNFNKDLLSGSIPKNWLIPLSKAKYLESLTISNSLISDLDLVAFSYSLRDSKLKNLTLKACEVKEMDTIITLFRNSNINTLEISCPAIDSVKKVLDMEARKKLNHKFKLQDISVDFVDCEFYGTLTFKTDTNERLPHPGAG